MSDETTYVPPDDPPEPSLALTLLLFAEYLDGQHLLLSHEQSRDWRSHEDLVADFQATRPDTL